MKTAKLSNKSRGAVDLVSVPDNDVQQQQVGMRMDVSECAVEVFVSR